MLNSKQLKAWYEERRDKEFLGFKLSAILKFLNYEDAKDYLKPETTEEEWNGDIHLELTKANVIKTMRHYMDFAWDKAINHRGISASRSVEKMTAWLSILEDEVLLAFIADDNYTNYGAPILKAICEKYKFPIPDDPIAIAMAKGERCPACIEGYESGCRR